MVDYLNELVENNDKKDAIFELCGKRFMTTSDNTTLVTSVGAPISTSTITSNFNLHAFHVLPWCDPKGNKIGLNTKPFPIYRCQNGIEIIIRMRNWAPVTTVFNLQSISNTTTTPLAINNAMINQIYINATTAVVVGQATGSLAYSLNQAYLFFKYHKVANPMMEKKIKMAYPFQTIRNLQTTQVDASIATNGTNAGVTVQLNGFAQGQTTNIIFHFVDLSQKTDIYSGCPIDNVKLLFNGKVIFQSNTLQDPMWDVLEANRKSLFNKRRFTVVGATEIQNDINYKQQYTPNVSAIEVLGYPYGGLASSNNAGFVPGATQVVGVTSNQPATNMGRQYYYVIPISETRLSEFNHLGEFSLGGNFSKESLQLQFRAPTSSGIGTLYVSYVYSGIYYISENRECTLSW
jgi:hypothetical protein